MYVSKHSMWRFFFRLRGLRVGSKHDLNPKQRWHPLSLVKPFRWPFLWLWAHLIVDTSDLGRRFCQRWIGRLRCTQPSSWTRTRDDVGTSRCGSRLHYRPYSIYQWASVTIIDWKSVKNRQNRSVKGPKFKKMKIDNLSSIIDANRTIYRFSYWKYVLAVEII